MISLLLLTLNSSITLFYAKFIEQFYEHQLLVNEFTENHILYLRSSVFYNSLSSFTSSKIYEEFVFIWFVVISSAFFSFFYLCLWCIYPRLYHEVKRVLFGGKASLPRSQTIQLPKILSGQRKYLSYPHKKVGESMRVILNRVLLLQQRMA